MEFIHIMCKYFLYKKIKLHFLMKWKWPISYYFQAPHASNFCDGENTASLLIKTALSGTQTDYGKLSSLFSMPGNVGRYYRDDITVVVLFFKWINLFYYFLYLYLTKKYRMMDFKMLYFLKFDNFKCYLFMVKYTFDKS